MNIILRQIIFVIIILYSADIAAQTNEGTPRKWELPDSTKSTLFWIGGSLGGGRAGGGFAVVATYVEDIHSISLRHEHNLQISLGGHGGGGSHPNISEYSLLYGRIKNSIGAIGRIAAGISYVYGFDNRSQRVNTIGLGVDCGWFYKADFVGIGLSFSGNINPQFPTYSFHLDLMFGDF